MTALITLTLAGADTGPFNLYSNVDGYISAFAVNITKAELLAGYPTNDIPPGTTIIKIKSVGVCLSSTEVIVPTTTTTTTTEAIVTNDYLIEGIWELDDPLHPEGGFVTYINSLSVESSITAIWLGESYNITAQSIVSSSGVAITLL